MTSSTWLSASKRESWYRTRSPSSWGCLDTFAQSSNCRRRTWRRMSKSISSLKISRRSKDKLTCYSNRRRCKHSRSRTMPINWVRVQFRSNKAQSKSVRKNVNSSSNSRIKTSKFQIWRNSCIEVTRSISQLPIVPKTKTSSSSKRLKIERSQKLIASKQSMRWRHFPKRRRD